MRVRAEMDRHVRGGIWGVGGERREAVEEHSNERRSVEEWRHKTT